MSQIFTHKPEKMSRFPAEPIGSSEKRPIPGNKYVKDVTAAATVQAGYYTGLGYTLNGLLIAMAQRPEMKTEFFQVVDRYLEQNPQAYPVSKNVSNSQIK